MRLIGLFLFSLATSSLFAADLELNGRVNQAVPQQNSSSSTKVQLLNIKLSPHAHEVLMARAKNTLAQQQENQLPTTSDNVSVQLGMNSVPVLDQGAHGSCVTFAITAALDAAIGRGDYISQVCSLQLGNYLSQFGYRLSGWEGSWGDWVYAQFNTFGIVNKTQQNKQGCGGVKKYPHYTTPTTAMSIEEYRSISEPLQSTVAWSVLLDRSQAFAHETDADELLVKTKNALNNGHRVTFSVLLPQVAWGTAGAMGWHHFFNDTWVFTKSMQKDINDLESLAGHELIVTGYDDQAVAMDWRGIRHKGLLTLRNSWGPSVGDWGDFYMSYDYYKTLTVEAMEVIPLTS